MLRKPIRISRLSEFPNFLPVPPGAEASSSFIICSITYLHRICGLNSATIDFSGAFLFAGACLASSSSLRFLSFSSYSSCNFLIASSCATVSLFAICYRPLFFAVFGFFSTAISITSSSRLVSSLLVESSNSAIAYLMCLGAFSRAILRAVF